MKNLFLAFAIMLTSSFAFANTNENFETISEKVTSVDLVTNNDCTLSFNHNEITIISEAATAECTLRGKFKLTFSDGSSITWEGELTIVGQTCLEFLKSLKN